LHRFRITNYISKHCKNNHAESSKKKAVLQVSNIKGGYMIGRNYTVKYAENFLNTL